VCWRMWTEGHCQCVVLATEAFNSLWSDLRTSLFDGSLVYYLALKMEVLGYSETSGLLPITRDNIPLDGTHSNQCAFLPVGATTLGEPWPPTTSLHLMLGY
jgi:hypothetical protein